MTDLAKVVRLEVTNDRLIKSRLARLPVELQACAEQSNRLFAPLLETCLDRFDDQLFACADASAEHKDQSIYFNAMRRVRQQRGAFLKRFGARLQEAFASLDTSEIAQVAPLTADSLSLMRPEDLDELIAVEAMITRSLKAFSQAIAQLSFRMDSLVTITVYARNNPIGPESLCQVLTSAALQLDVPASVKLILLKAFEETVLVALEPVYGALNEILSGGIKNPLDNTKDSHQTPVGSAQRKSAAGNQQTQKTSKVAVESNSSKSVHSQSFDEELATVLNELAQGTGSERQSIKGVTTTALVHLLSPLQRLPFEQVMQPEDLVSALGRHTGQVIELTRSQRETVNLVSILFQFVLEDKTIPADFSQVLLRLQIPLFKVALLDSDFFNQKGHGARRLLNEIALSAIGWPSNQEDPLFRKAVAVIRAVTENFDTNTSLFAVLLEDFSALFEQEKRRAAFSERRLTNAEDGKMQAEKARKRVAVEVGLRTDGFYLVEPLREFVTTVWFQVLFVRCLRAGNDTLPWRDGLQALTDLVWSVQPLKTAKDRHALIVMVPNLMERLRLGLEEIGFDPFATADFFTLLNRIHRDSVAGFLTIKSPAEVSQANSEKSKFSEPQASSAAKTMEGPDDLHWQQVATFTPGTWFDFIEIDKPVLRCRLAAVIKQTGNYIFVNRSGVKVAERDHRQLAQGLRTGQLRPIDSSLLYDRALEEVVAGLRKTNKSPLDMPQTKQDKKD